MSQHSVESDQQTEQKYSGHWFWNSVESIYGPIPDLVKMVLALNGFDSLLTLKGLHWEDKKQFFRELEETVTNLMYLDEENVNRKDFEEELLKSNQNLSQFKLKLGHKNLVLNLCHLLTNITLDEFHQRRFNNQPSGSEPKAFKEEPANSPVFVKPEHGYSKKKVKAQEYVQEIQEEEQEYEMVEGYDEELLYEEVEETEEALLTEIIEDEFQQESDTEYIYSDSNEPAVKKQEYEYNNYTEDENYEPARKKQAVHIEYSEESFVASKPKKSNRRPKLHKKYSDDDEGRLERWHDLVKQSLEVVLPKDLLDAQQIDAIFIQKLTENTWEVHCPMCLCDKKLKLQLTKEGKYTNYKRSNFERHLRIVHLRTALEDIEDGKASFNYHQMNLIE
ncbi:unnamed protein product [Diamesa hyperborea]